MTSITTFQTRTPADVYAQIQLERDGISVDVLIADFDGYRSDALPSQDEWARIIDANIKPEHRNGSYDVVAYIASKRETDPGRDRFLSFREDLVLSHWGKIKFADDGTLLPVAISPKPMRSDIEGNLHTLSDEALAAWSYDLEDMLDAYDEGEDGHILRNAFLAAH